MSKDQLHQNECEAHGRCYGIFLTEQEEGSMPVAMFHGNTAEKDAEREIMRRQKLDRWDSMWLPEQVGVFRCDVEIVCWNSYEADPFA